jgi:hypothetical protein
MPALLPADRPAIARIRARPRGDGKAVLAVLYLGRLVLLLLAADAGAVILRNVTLALCLATHTHPPPWSLHG